MNAVNISISSMRLMEVYMYYFYFQKGFKAALTYYEHSPVFENPIEMQPNSKNIVKNMFIISIGIYFFIVVF